jgi:dienelactone hydrolase
MDAGRSVSRAALCALVLILTSCSGAGVAETEQSSSSVEPETAPPTTSPDSGANVVVTRDLAYESSSLTELGMLDVYAPFYASGDWPVVVMFHGGTWGVYKSYLATYAMRVAELGFVVFVPSWGHSGGAEYDALTVKDQVAADAAQAACAAAFAAEHAGEYGGDASAFTVFGHSFGANVGSVVTLARPALADGCLATDLPQVDAFVPWEGDWLLVSSFADPWLVEDPTLLEVITPWAHLPAPTDLEIAFLRTDNPGEGRSSADATGPDGWLALRDPDGTFTAALEAIGALGQDIIGPAASDTILIDALEAQGGNVSLKIMPDSSHEHLSDAGWSVFLEAFGELGAS